MVAIWNVGGAKCRNEGQLSSKYYDPELRRRLDSDAKFERRSSHDQKDKSSEGSGSRGHGVYPRSDHVVVGPTLPSREDLQLQKGISPVLTKANHPQNNSLRTPRKRPRCTLSNAKQHAVSKRNN